MRVLVYDSDNLCVSEKATSYVEECLLKIQNHISNMVILGNDEQRRISKEFARRYNIDVIEPKDDSRLSDVRNCFADLFVIFWDGQDCKTRDTIIQLKAAGKNTKVFFYDPNLSK